MPFFSSLLTILLASGATSAQSLHQRYADGLRAADEAREDRDPLDPGFVARERMRGFQSLVSTMVGSLAANGFYVDRPRLLGAAIVPTPSLEVTVRNRPPTGHGPIVQELEVFYVRNNQICRVLGWATSLNSLSKSTVERFFERSTYPQVIIRAQGCVAAVGPKRP